MGVRARRRTSSPEGTRARTIPARSRMTVRRSEAPLVRQGQLAAALRSSREALTDLEGQLEALLVALRAPRATLAAQAHEVAGATADASAALARLGALARRG
jgi:hypothetical protein